MKCRAVLRLALAPVVEAGSGDIGVPEPFLDLGNKHGGGLRGTFAFRAIVYRITLIMENRAG
jgi:hypothetical protein